MASAALISFFFLALPFYVLNSPLLVSADADLIQKTCQATKYYGLCMTSLQNNPKSLQAEVPGLASIISNLAMTRATDTSSYLSKLTNSTRDPPLKWALGECANRYRDASAALDGSIQEIESESNDYAYVQVTAAKDYPNSCHNLFRLKQGVFNSKLKYPAALAKREEGLVRLCDVGLGIIGLLGDD